MFACCSVLGWEDLDVVDPDGEAAAKVGAPGSEGIKAEVRSGQAPYALCILCVAPPAVHLLAASYPMLSLADMIL